jgi:flagellar biosynthesis/type III secretory pathway chaperone
MHELLTELIEILETQRDAQAALVALSERKTQAITKGDGAGLQAIVDEERIVLARIKVIEKKQSQCGAKLAPLLNVAASEIRMTVVIEQAQGDQKRRLEALRDELGALIDQQSKLNDVNMKLLQMNMDYVQFMINASSNQRAEPTYGSGGAQKAAGSVKRLLDRKV